MGQKAPPPPGIRVKGGGFTLLLSYLFTVDNLRENLKSMKVLERYIWSLKGDASELKVYDGGLWSELGTSRVKTASFRGLLGFVRVWRGTVMRFGIYDILEGNY